eukprot:gene7739-5428_t
MFVLLCIFIFDELYFSSICSPFDTLPTKFSAALLRQLPSLAFMSAALFGSSFEKKK